MASSGLQLLGYFLSLIGLAATVAATLMVQWKKQYQDKTYRIYDGLWRNCRGDEITTCEFHQYLLKLPTEVQATRAVMLVSIFLSSVALMVSTVGMKCTRFMDGKAEAKSKVAMIGGIMFVIAGLLTITITSLYVKMIVQISYESHSLQNAEIGNAVFVSWAGGFFTTVGGAFLSCRRCSKAQNGSNSSNHLLPTTNPKSNYV